MYLRKMKLIIRFGALIIFSFICYCFFFDDQIEDYEKIAAKITAHTAKKLNQQENLCLVGTGGQMMDDIQMMAMSFDYYQEVDLQKARELIANAVEAYLFAINSDEQIKPYLHDYPFTAKNVGIRLWIYNPDRSKLPLEKIGYVSSLNGIIEYYDRLNVMQPIHRETYEEALQTLSFQGSIN